MTEPLHDTKTSRDLPVLREVVRRLEADTYGRGVTDEEVADALDMDIADVRRAATVLQAKGYVEWHRDFEEGLEFRRFLGPAVEAVGMWPTPETALDRMITALEAIAADTDVDDETRKEARGFGTWLKTSATTVGLGVVTAAITGQLPGQ